MQNIFISFDKSRKKLKVFGWGEPPMHTIFSTCRLFMVMRMEVLTQTFSMWCLSVVPIRYKEKRLPTSMLCEEMLFCSKQFHVNLLRFGCCERWRECIFRLNSHRKQNWITKIDSLHKVQTMRCSCSTKQPNKSRNGEWKKENEWRSCRSNSEHYIFMGTNMRA